jgi:two-component system NtrC family response regulator
MSLENLLIIDDEDRFRQLLSRVVELEGFKIHEAANAKAALRKLEQHEIHIVICDVKLPDVNGIDLITRIRSKYPEIEIIMLTAYGNISDGVQSMKNGAFDYLTKGDDNDKIIPLLHRAVEKVALHKRIQELEKQVEQKYSFDKIIGRSKQTLSAIALAEKVAPTDTTVLLLGETGTGKEVFAQSIHTGSSRRSNAFIAVNCSTFSKDLLENELFGHKAGAYTGADKDSKGLFEEANRGTIFLDEIGELNLDLQAKLLRVLETGEFIKVGDSLPTKVDVRIITATNSDLAKESDLGYFRNDLYYRLSVFRILLSPLRERIKDIEPLAEFFMGRFSAKTRKHILKMDADYLQKLESYSWKGNIRELKNVIERSVILSDDNVLQSTTLPPEIQFFSQSGAPASELSLAEMEKGHIRKVLNYTGGNKTEAARLLEIGLTTLYRKIEEFKI